jgi:EAL domain-containing protein (putative c-di-GMP-specific phosphodiesterase class I)
MCVVAEGVETEQQRAALEALGCEAAQGYLFSPAVPAAQADALVRRVWPSAVVVA